MSRPLTAARAPRRHVVAWAASGVVVAVTIFALAHLALGDPTPPPTPAERVVAQFYAAVARQDYGTAYHLFADSQQAIITADAFTLSARLLDQQGGTVTAYREISATPSAATTSPTTILEQVTRSQRGTYEVTLQLTQNAAGAWQIASESGV